MKDLLILKAHYDSIELSAGNCRPIFSIEDFVDSEPMLHAVLHRLSAKLKKFDIICIFCPSNHEYLNFDLTERHDVSWVRFAHLLCEYDLLNENASIVSTGFNGNLLRLAADMFSICNKLSAIYGITEQIDIPTDWLKSMTENPILGGQSNHLYDCIAGPEMNILKCNRSDLGHIPAYENRKWQLYKELEWANGDGKWIERDDVIWKNVGLFE